MMDGRHFENCINIISAITWQHYPILAKLYARTQNLMLIMVHMTNMANF